jgi:hypothetical protein
MLFVFGRVTKQVRYGLPAWCSVRYTLPSRAHPAGECQVASRAGLSHHFLPIFRLIPLKVTHVTFTQQMSNRDSMCYLYLNSMPYEAFVH